MSSRTVLTHRTVVKACRQLGANASRGWMARELAVCWWTVMEAVKAHGTLLVVESRDRVGPVTNLGIEETSSSRPPPPIRPFATGLGGLDRPMIIDMDEAPG